MEKYNEFVEAFVAGEAEYERVNKETMEEAIKVAKEKSHKAFESFVEEMESKVADWTREDLDRFVKFAKEDNRIDTKDVVLVMEVYRRTHIGQEDNVSTSGILLMLTLMDVLSE